MQDDTRDIAIMALTRVTSHEELCAARWQTTVKLLWGALGGVALLLLSRALDYIVVLPHVVK